MYLYLKKKLNSTLTPTPPHLNTRARLQFALPRLKVYSSDSHHEGLPIVNKTQASTHTILATPVQKGNDNETATLNQIPNALVEYLIFNSIIASTKIGSHLYIQNLHPIMICDNILLKKFFTLKQLFVIYSFEYAFNC